MARQPAENKSRKRLLGAVLLLALLLFGCAGEPAGSNQGSGEFQGERAFQDIQRQLAFGPRYPGAPGHEEIRDWIVQELAAAGWTPEVQIGIQDGQPVYNVTADRGGEQGMILLGAHYDTREFADQDPDPDLQGQPVPGANDGASGVAVLLELARVLPTDQEPPVRLVFFDAEDNGRIRGQDWILGSRYYAEHMEGPPEAVVILDMIGDRDLTIYQEKTSTGWLQDQIWTAARDLGYSDVFLEREKYSILDDHTPFLEAGVPAVDLIDFDYPAWHTTGDNLAKVSPDSLQIVGETVLHWLAGYRSPE